VTTEPRTTLAGVRRVEGGLIERMLLSPAGLGSLLVSAISVFAAVQLWSRVGLSAEAVARTAHLANLISGYDQIALAFGIERPPLPTMLGFLFATVPELRTGGLAVALGLAAASGIAVAVANGLGRWAGLGRRTHVVFVVAFALHPLLLLSSAAGLPEALYATLLLGAFSQFARWLDREMTAPLIASGTALGAAFLLRYDVLLVAAAMATCIYFVALTREQGVENVERAQATTVAFSVPVVFVVGFWTVTTWFAHGDLFEFVRDAAHLTALSANSAEVVAQRIELAWNFGATTLWLGGWALALAPLSVVAVVGLAAYGLAAADRPALALAAALGSIALPALLGVVTGLAQPQVAHLIPLVVPAFVVVAYIERRRGGGRRPFQYERGARRRQVALVVLLVIAAVGSGWRLSAAPASAFPLQVAASTLLAGSGPQQDEAVELTASWLRQNAGPGEVLVDTERTAAVYLAVGRPEYFRTPEDRSGPAVIANPQGVATLLLTRRPVAGTARGAIERAYPTLWDRPRSDLELAHEAGEYRIYRIITEVTDNTRQ
jgi:hypothetical protein